MDAVIFTSSTAFIHLQYAVYQGEGGGGVYLYLSITLDHVYMNTAEAYKPIPLPHVGQSDHLSLVILPKYMPLINHVKPSVRSVKVGRRGRSPHYNTSFKKLTGVRLPHRPPCARTQI